MHIYYILEVQSEAMVIYIVHIDPCYGLIFSFLKFELFNICDFYIEIYLQIKFYIYFLEFCIILFIKQNEKFIKIYKS